MHARAHTRTRLSASVDTNRAFISEDRLLHGQCGYAPY